MKHTLKIVLALSALILGLSNAKAYCRDVGRSSPISEPYPFISSGSFSGGAVLQSPDPLISYRWVNPRAADGLEIYTLRPVKVTTDKLGSFSNLNSLKGNRPDVTVRGPGSIMLDFGSENAAWLEFDSPDLAGSVEMSISEYNEPAIVNVGPECPVKSKVPVKHGDTYRLQLNKRLYEGVRFGWIHVRKFTRPWHITGIRLVCQIKPTNYNGSFTCSDTMLTRIWYTGAYTVKLNLLKRYFGAILMDRGDRHSWTGDSYPAQAASMVAFANYKFVRTNIEFTSEQNNGIASYPLYWVLSLIDYFNYTGDTATLEKYLSNACAKLDTSYAQYGKDPNLGFYGWDERLGAGFENPNCQEAENAYKMLSIRAWREFSKAMKEIGRTDLYKKYKRYADAKVRELRRKRDWYASFGLHAEAGAVDAGFTTKKEQEAFYKEEFSNRVNRLSYSPFNQYFIIQAMATMGRFDDAISCIKDLWGGQIRYGGTTFFEIYRPSWNKVIGKNGAPVNGQNGYTSLCHPWSAGVTKWLTEEILGIKPTSPGFSTYAILPHLGRSLTSVAGKVLTPHGDISASFNVSTGVCRITTPAGTVGRVGIPKVGKTIRSIRLNGRLVWKDGRYDKAKGITEAYQDDKFVYFAGLRAGKYDFSVSYSGTTPAYGALPWKYAAKFVKEDSITEGNWGGVYGSDGYILLSYMDSTKNLMKLPSYVASVKYGKDIKCRWAEGVSDRRALAPDAQNVYPRNAGCIHTNDPIACDQTMTIDIALKQARPYKVALFFVDWDSGGRRTAVEMFDLRTKNLIAPVEIVRNYRNGKYLVFQYDRSVRLRIDQVRGPNATLSGVFFDH